MKSFSRLLKMFFCALGEVWSVFGEAKPAPHEQANEAQAPTAKLHQPDLPPLPLTTWSPGGVSTTLRISCCHDVGPIYTRQVRLNWKFLRLAIIPVFALLLATGCSGINASGSVSPATFLLPGLGQARPEPVQPTVPVPASETAHLLARSH